MVTKKMYPSDFTEYPWNSILKKCESEIVAQNIMVILKRVGNKFKNIKWEEYKAERLKDGSFTNSEKSHFNDVIDYCRSADTAQLFSKVWADK